MNEISIETQEWIIKLVKKQKKVELGFISRATDVSVEDIIKNADKMGLIADGECLLCPTYHDTVLIESKTEFERSLIREITDGDVFCPKCGKRNNFSFGKPGETTNYYCAYCHGWLNYYWEEYQKGEITLNNCEACQQPTFDQEKFCISCGLVQRSYKPKYISKPVRTGKPQKNALLAIFLIPLGIVTILTFIFFILCASTPNSLDSIWFEIFFGLLIFGFPSAIGFAIISLGLYAIISYTRKKKKLVLLEEE